MRRHGSTLEVCLARHIGKYYQFQNEVDWEAWIKMHIYYEETTGLIYTLELYSEVIIGLYKNTLLRDCPKESRDVGLKEMKRCQNTRTKLEDMS